MILLRNGQLRDPLASSGFVCAQVDVIHMFLSTVLHSFGLHSSEQTRH